MMESVVKSRRSESCYIHSDTEATACCYNCLKRMCKACTVYDELRSYCPECFKKIKIRNKLRKLLPIIGGVVCLVVAVVYLYGGGYSFDYGKHAIKIRQLKGYLSKEPCDRRKILELTRTLVKVGDNREAIERVNDYLDKCGEFTRLRWVTLGAYRNLSEWDNAIREATAIIDSNPYDKDYWWWRGQAYEDKGDLENAARDYEQSMVIQPKIKRVPFNLARVYERMGRYCDAIMPLQQYIYYYPDSDPNNVIQNQIDRLDLTGECSLSVSGDKLRLKYNPSGMTIKVNVVVNEKYNGTFLLDTGATYVALTKKFAEGIGVPYKKGREIYLHTAGGDQKAYLTTADTIQFKNLKAKKVRVVVMDSMSGNIDGLLGLSFLSRFTMRMDAAKGILELERRGNG